MTVIYVWGYSTDVVEEFSGDYLPWCDQCGSTDRGIQACIVCFHCTRCCTCKEPTIDRDDFFGGLG